MRRAKRRADEEGNRRDIDKFLAMLPAAASVNEPAARLLEKRKTGKPLTALDIYGFKGVLDTIYSQYAQKMADDGLIPVDDIPAFAEFALRRGPELDTLEERRGAQKQFYTDSYAGRWAEAALQNYAIPPDDTPLADFDPGFIDTSMGEDSHQAGKWTQRGSIVLRRAMDQAFAGLPPGPMDRGELERQFIKWFRGAVHIKREDRLWQGVPRRALVRGHSMVPVKCQQQFNERARHANYDEKNHYQTRMLMQRFSHSSCYYPFFRVARGLCPGRKAL